MKSLRKLILAVALVYSKEFSEMLSWESRLSGAPNKLINTNQLINWTLHSLAAE
jgi:hypothetical protein